MRYLYSKNGAIGFHYLPPGKVKVLKFVSPLIFFFVFPFSFWKMAKCQVVSVFNIKSPLKSYGSLHIITDHKLVGWNKACHR
ncbi:hypothetical protein BT93_F1867 [Corymbia citriodora subsp. variegata]|nr:hypothetical protein BT93_F1867 [Corymbia citriodora subsp. variegata]